MSTPNPLAPQGSLLEKQGRGRSTFQIISFIGALHVFVLCALLWIGCKQDKPATAGGTDTALPGQDGGLPPIQDPPPVDPSATNVVAVPATNPPVVLAPVPGVVGATSAPVTGPGPGATGAQPPLGVGGTAPGTDPLGATGSPVAGATEHKVAPGDTGVVIARKHGVTVAALKAANPTVNWNKLKPGQVVAIPAASGKPASSTQGSAPVTGATEPSGGALAGESSYTVRPGDTGSKIAKKVGVAWRKIRDANGLTSDSLKPGQKLTIPAKGAPASGAGAEVPAAAPGGAVAPDPVRVPVVTPLPAAGGR